MVTVAHNASRSAGLPMHRAADAVHLSIGNYIHDGPSIRTLENPQPEKRSGNYPTVH